MRRCERRCLLTHGGGVAPTATLSAIAPAPGPVVDTTQGEMIIQMPRAAMARLRPYILAGAMTRQSPSRATAMPMTGLLSASSGRAPEKWTVQGQMAQ